MKPVVFLYFLLATLLTVNVTGQSVSTAQPVVYQLPSATYDSVKHLLKKSWAPALKDTIIIQYQPELPEGLVKESDEIIQQNITGELRFLHNALVSRKNITVLQYAAEGPANSKLQQFNNLISIDQGNLLHGLLLREYPGGSLMLLPDGTCILFPGNEKWTAVKTSPLAIQHALSKELAKK